MSKAVFLDRDGTINKEKHYLYKIEDFEFIPRCVEGLKKLQDLGYLIIIITNQSGIARGYYTEDDLNILNRWIVNELKKSNITISGIYYCPHHPEAEINKYRVNCSCRKPSLGLFFEAIKDFNIDLSLSYAIGDKIRDSAICEKSICRGYLIGHNESVDVISKVKNGIYKNIKYADDLYACALDIEKEQGGKV